MNILTWDRRRCPLGHVLLALGYFFYDIKPGGFLLVLHEMYGLKCNQIFWGVWLGLT